MAFSFLINLLLANILLPASFGTFSLLVVNTGLLSLITGLGTDSIIMYSLANKKWNIDQAFTFAWKMVGIQIAAFFFLQFLFQLFAHKTLLSLNPLAYFFIDLAYFTGFILTEKYLVLFYAQHRARQVNRFLFLQAVFYLLILLFLKQTVQLSSSTVFIIIGVQSLAQGLLLAGYFQIVEKRIAWKRIDRSELGTTIKMSFIVMITNVVQLFAYRIDFWLIESYFSKYEVGIYAQANKFAHLLWIVPNILSLMLVPRFSQLDKRNFPALLKIAALSNALILLATIFCTQIFYTFFLKNDYRQGLMPFYLMLPGYFFWSIVIYIGAYVSWAGKFVYNLLCSSFCFVVIFLADVLLIPRLSIEGAAIANTIAYTATFVLYLFLLNYKFAFRLGDFFWLKKQDFSIIKLLNK